MAIREAYRPRGFTHYDPIIDLFLGKKRVSARNRDEWDATIFQEHRDGEYNVTPEACVDGPYIYNLQVLEGKGHLVRDLNPDARLYPLRRALATIRRNLGLREKKIIHMPPNVGVPIPDINRYYKILSYVPDDQRESTIVPVDPHTHTAPVPIDVFKVPVLV